MNVDTAAGTYTASQWKNRIVLEIAEGQVKRLKKGKKAQVMLNKQIYVIVPATPMKLLKYGARKVNRALAIELLKRIAEGGE